MKVLSIKEPYASLIKDKKKLIETRSWNTNYRGELYIHASCTKLSKEYLVNDELKKLIDKIQTNCGYILCKCKLVDCIYMTKEFTQNIKSNNYQEYVCGVYEEGRYAWVLQDIVPLSVPIKAKGALNIWDFYDEFMVMDLMRDITYGFIDKYNNKQYFINDDFPLNYRLQSPKEVIKNKIGVCWDQVELERYYFKRNPWNIETYFLVYYDNKKCPTHTFLTFMRNDKYYWFEHSWELFVGIHEYNSLNELLIDVKNKFIKYELNNNYNKDNLCLFKYRKPKYHITVDEFYHHCELGEYIDFTKL